MSNEYMCLADRAMTHTILKKNEFFSHLVMQDVNISTIFGSTHIIESSGKANILLPGGTKFHIHNALYSCKSHTNLLSFKDICLQNLANQLLNVFTNPTRVTNHMFQLLMLQ